MPIYAFECGSCGHEFERLQRLADADPTECPECHATQVRRQLTAPSFRLAGAGWYETDFKKDGDKKRNLADKGESSSDGGASKASESKSDSKSETKPESKAETKSPAKVETKSEAKPAVKPAADK
jgi:putative FmdB family regulatory protein